MVFSCPDQLEQPSRMVVQYLLPHIDQALSFWGSIRLPSPYSRIGNGTWFYCSSREWIAQRKAPSPTTPKENWRLAQSRMKAQADKKRDRKGIWGRRLGLFEIQAVSTNLGYSKKVLEARTQISQPDCSHTSFNCLLDQRLIRPCFATKEETG